LPSSATSSGSAGSTAIRRRRPTLQGERTPARPSSAWPARGFTGRRC
jgi:hypothetical protein